MWQVVLAISPLWTILLTGQPFAGSVSEAHSGKPLRGARIQVRLPGAPRLIADLESTGDGTFRAGTSLSSGEYAFSISKPNYAEAILRLQLPLRGPLAIQLVRLGSITGTVTNSENQPMRRVNVILLAVEADGRLRRLPNGSQTDDTGQYRLFNLAPGRYAVAVSWATLNPGASVNGAYLFPNNQRPEIFSIVSGASLRGIDFARLPQSTFTVSGRLHLDDPNKSGGVTLILRKQPLLPVAMVKTEPNGAFRMEGIPPGAYELMAAAPSSGYAGFGVVLDRDPVFARVPVDVAGQPLSDLAVTPEPGRNLSLSLQSEAGCPPMATVTLAPAENWGALLERSLTLNTTTPTTAKDLAPGLYRAVVSIPAEHCFGAADLFVDVRKTESIRIPLIRGGSIRGRIEPDGEIQAAVVLTALDIPQATVQYAIASREGNFQFSELRPGRYRVQAGSATESVLVRSNQSTPVLLKTGEQR